MYTQLYSSGACPSTYHHRIRYNIDMHPLLERLSGGDRRSIGRSNEAVAEVLAEPGLFGVLIEGLLNADPLIRMRCADALEKITILHPEYLQPFKLIVLDQVASIEQQEVRWHTAQLIPRLALTPEERSRAVSFLGSYLSDNSSIVKTFAMQALADLAAQDDSLREMIVPKLETLTQQGTPAMQSRGRKLLAKLKHQHP
jgi:hypothetical protein